MSYLVDTNVISELRKGPRADQGVTDWLASVNDFELFLSALTVGELRQGIERIRSRDRVSAVHLERWLHGIVTSFEDRILPVDAQVADAWGRLNAAKQTPVVDGLLAATAQVRDLTLVTRNIKDVQRTGVRCLDPFTGH
ncbi:MAG: type II toxin-antitoxin system VapC family toxin [Vicinamibacterales bacterium]